MNRLRSAATKSLTVLAVVCVLGGCGAGDDGASESTGATAPATSAPVSETDGEPAGANDTVCGVTLAEVQAVLPTGSGVTQNDTPDARRCNFTWDDGGPRGIDVAIVPGGRSSFDVPAGYEPIDGYGDEAYTSSVPGRASAFAFVGADLYAVDVTAFDADDDLTDVCLQSLALAIA